MVTARRLLRADRVVVGGGVDAAVNAQGVEADVLHDVDLAAGRPSDLSTVGAEHPDGWPGAVAGGQLRADLYAAVQ